MRQASSLRLYLARSSPAKGGDRDSVTVDLAGKAHAIDVEQFRRGALVVERRASVTRMCSRSTSADG